MVAPDLPRHETAFEPVGTSAFYPEQEGGSMTSTLKRYVPTVALLVVLSLFLPFGWLAIPAVILLVQVVTGRPGRLLRAITSGNSLRR